MNRVRNRQQHRLVFGLFILIVGVVSLLGNLHIINAAQAAEYWPIVFCALGAVKIHHSRGPRTLVVGGGLIALGVLWTLSNLDYLRVHIVAFWPLLIILVGVSTIMNGLSRRGETQDSDVRRWRRTESTSEVSATAILSGAVIRNDSQDFKGGDVSAVLGGIDLDLRMASIDGKATLRVFALMGGIEIKIPQDWSTTINGVPIMGGIEDKSVPPMQTGKQLIIEGEVIMGGIEIKN